MFERFWNWVKKVASPAKITITESINSIKQTQVTNFLDPRDGIEEQKGNPFKGLTKQETINAVNKRLPEIEQHKKQKSSESEMKISAELRKNNIAEDPKMLTKILKINNVIDKGESLKAEEKLALKGIIDDFKNKNMEFWSQQESRILKLAIIKRVIDKQNSEKQAIYPTFDELEKYIINELEKNNELEKRKLSNKDIIQSANKELVEAEELHRKVTKELGQNLPGQVAPKVEELYDPFANYALEENKREAVKLNQELERYEGNRGSSGSPGKQNGKVDLTRDGKEKPFCVTGVGSANNNRAVPTTYRKGCEPHAPQI